MRSLGLGAAVVVVIFAAAFGVYYWLAGDPESAVQVEGPATSPAASSTAADTAVAPAQVSQAQQAPETSAEQSPAKQDTPAASGSSDTVSQSAGGTAPSVSPSSGEGQPTQNQTNAAPGSDTSPDTPETKDAAETASTGPQVVARVVEKIESAVSGSDDQAPSFDVVRVEKSGEAILAGRAPAGSEVTVYDGDTPLGIVTADERGQWVLILDIPLSPGSHSLGVTARLGDGAQIVSENLVIVAVPEPQETLVAGERPEGPGATDSPDEGYEDGQQIASRTGGSEAANASPDAQSADSGSEPADVLDSPVAPSQVAVANTGVTEPLAVIVPRSGSGPSRVLQQPATKGEGIGDGGLFLDSVDYDDDGRAVIGGRASAGATLIIYLDNIPVGEALTGDDGRWVMTPENLVPAGLHRLRVDQVERDGKVLARVETPFSRAETVANNPDEAFVTVQPGNSLWRIARTTYGQGTRYTVIYETNKDQIRDPDLIYPGQIFRLPSGG